MVQKKVYMCISYHKIQNWLNNGVNIFYLFDITCGPKDVCNRFVFLLQFQLCHLHSLNSITLKKAYVYISNRFKSFVSGNLQTFKCISIHNLSIIKLQFQPDASLHSYCISLKRMVSAMS